MSKDKWWGTKIFHRDLHTTKRKMVKSVALNKDEPLGHEHVQRWRNTKILDDPIKFSEHSWFSFYQGYLKVCYACLIFYCFGQKKGCLSCLANLSTVGTVCFLFCSTCLLLYRVQDSIHPVQFQSLCISHPSVPFKLTLLIC